MSLCSPSTFPWASSFQKSKAVDLLRQNKEFIIFGIPPSCPQKEAPACSADRVVDLPPEPRTPPSSQRKAALKPIVETDIRHSDRIREKPKGFKKNLCNDKGCLACSVTPSLSPSVIKNLGASFL